MGKEILPLGLIKDSIMFGENISADITVRVGNVASKGFIAEVPTLSLWINGGNSYDFNISRELAEKLDAMTASELNGYARSLATKVVISIQAEITALELGV